MAKRLIVRRRIDFRVIALRSGKYTRPHRCNTRVHHGSGSGEVRHTRGDTATISTPGSRLVNLIPYGDAASHGTSPISRRGRNERKKGRGGERERERGAVCGFGRYADRRSRCAVCNIARGTVVAWATPSVTLRLFYPGPVVGLVSLESRQKKTAKSGKDDRGKMIVYDGLDVTIGVIDAP